MQKIKSLNFSSFLSILKCCLLGVVATLAGIVVFAVVLKFVDLSSVAISAVNNVIKGVSIFIMVACINKSNQGKLLFKAVFGGVLYALISFLIFSILNGGIVFDMAFVYDLLFAVAVAAICSVIVNILSRKNA